MRHLMSLNAFEVWDERKGNEGLDLQDQSEAEIWRSYGL
jgi:hypothetical protein